MGRAEEGKPDNLCDGERPKCLALFSLGHRDAADDRLCLGWGGKKTQAGREEGRTYFLPPLIIPELWALFRHGKGRV